jgi:hypothetical protein
MQSERFLLELIGLRRAGSPRLRRAAVSVLARIAPDDEIDDEELLERSHLREAVALAALALAEDDPRAAFAQLCWAGESLDGLAGTLPPPVEEVPGIVVTRPGVDEPVRSPTALHLLAAARAALAALDAEGAMTIASSRLS